MDCEPEDEQVDGGRGGEMNIRQRTSQADHPLDGG